MAQNKDLVADAQTLREENLSEKKSVESARRVTICDEMDFWIAPKVIEFYTKLFQDLEPTSILPGYLYIDTLYP